MKKTISIEVYKDEQNRPTCAKYFPSGEFCPFLRTVRFGFEDICCISKLTKYNGSPISLLRYDNNEGRLIPTEDCLLWHGEQNENN